jgi:hypothetical protein
MFIGCHGSGLCINRKSTVYFVRMGVESGGLYVEMSFWVLAVGRLALVRVWMFPGCFVYAACVVVLLLSCCRFYFSCFSWFPFVLFLVCGVVYAPCVCCCGTWGVLAL